ncbi:MAG: HupE/UreJ family protein, partial [Opitutus sp.]
MVCASFRVLPAVAEDAASQVKIEAPAGAVDPAQPVEGNVRQEPRASQIPQRRNERDTGSLFWSFLRLGVTHIWTGYDHLLFLFGLLIVCRTLRTVVAIISCFTVAHSLTLALATFDLATLSPRWVEPAIAASIVFVGLENLWRRGAEPRGRMLVTFCFGLVHGFGFANVLRGLGVGSGGRGIALPLFTFNLGVELGQIAVASLVLPIMWQL